MIDTTGTTSARQHVMLVVAAALERADGTVLVQQRPAGKHHAGLWEFPGGKVEAGETAEAALARELSEELGIVIDPRDAFPATFASVSGIDRPIILLLFRVTRWQGEPVPIEAAGLHWAMPADLKTMAMPPGDVALVDFLRGGGSVRGTAGAS